MEETNKAIVIKNLTKAYKDNQVLKGINLEVERGTMLALLGPNGAGKTTIVSILSTLLSSDSGEVFVNGYNINTHAHEVRQSIGLTSQYAAVDEFLSGRENLEMMGQLFHLSKSDSKKRAQELLEQFDLVDAASRPAKTYSGGMRRRLDLAISLIPTPPVVYLDEPTTGLDPRSRLAMWKVIKELVAADVTILLTTQYLEEADQLADKIAVIDNGMVIAEGTSDELKSKVGKERLELQFDTDALYNQAVAAFDVYHVQKIDSDKKISIAVENGVEDIIKYLEIAKQNNLPISSMSIHKPTLDDVFLQLTGHQAEDVNQTAAEKEIK